jgi:hypothetical protein
MTIDEAFEAMRLYARFNRLRLNEVANAFMTRP